MNRGVLFGVVGEDIAFNAVSKVGELFADATQVCEPFPGKVKSHDNGQPGGERLGRARHSWLVRAHEKAPPIGGAGDGSRV